jgi:hypothetical protein
MNTNNKKEKVSGANPGNLNIGIPSSISPRNKKEDDSFRSDSDAAGGEAVIIDD